MDALRHGDAILVGSTTSYVKTTCRKSCPASLLQVSNLIFDPYFKIQLGYHIEKAFCLPYYYCCSLGFELFFWADHLHFC